MGSQYGMASALADIDKGYEGEEAAKAGRAAAGQESEGKELKPEEKAYLEMLKARLQAIKK